MKLIIVRELSRFMTLEHVGKFLDLTEDENYAFCALCLEESERRAEEDRLLQRINERELALLTSDSRFLEKQYNDIWEEEHTIWREKHDGNDPMGPSAFSISRSEIQLAKRFLSDFMTRDDFSVAAKEKKYLPTANDIERVFRLIENYEGTSTFWMNLDFDDFDGKHDDDDEDDIGGMHARVSRPPTNCLQSTAAISDDSLKRSAVTDQEPIRSTKRLRKEDADYSSELDDSGEESDNYIVVGSRPTTFESPPSSFRTEKKNPVGRPRGSTKKQRERQKSPHKKFAVPEAWDGKGAPYDLLSKEKAIRVPRKIVKIKLPGSKLSRFSTPDTAEPPSTSPAISQCKNLKAGPKGAEDERRSIVDSLVGPTLPAESLDLPVVAMKEPVKAPDSTASQGLQLNLNKALSQLQNKDQTIDSQVDPYKAAYNIQVPPQGASNTANQPNPKPVKQSNPPIANTGTSRLAPQAQRQRLDAINAPALLPMFTPQPQATNTSQVQSPQQVAHPPPAFGGSKEDPSKSQTKVPTFCGPQEDLNNKLPRPQGIVPGIPAPTNSFLPPHNHMGNPNSALSKSNDPSLITHPFYAQNPSYGQWLNPSTASTAITYPDTSLERQKAHMYQNTQMQTPGYFSGPLATSPSVLASGKQHQQVPVHDNVAQAAYARLIETVGAQPNGNTPVPLPAAASLSNTTHGVNSQGNASGSVRTTTTWPQPLPSDLEFLGFAPSTGAGAPNNVPNRASMYNSVRPMPPIEPHMRKNPSPYSSPRPAQASMGVLVPQTPINGIPQKPKNLNAQTPINTPAPNNDPISSWGDRNNVIEQGTRGIQATKPRYTAPNRHTAVMPSIPSCPSTPRLTSYQQSGLTPSNTPLGPTTHKSGPCQQNGVIPSATSFGPSLMKPGMTQPRAQAIPQAMTGRVPQGTRTYDQFFASSNLSALAVAPTSPTPPHVEPQAPVNTSPKSSQSPVSASDSTSVAGTSSKETISYRFNPIFKRYEAVLTRPLDSARETPSSSLSPDAECQPPLSRTSPDPESQSTPSSIYPRADTQPVTSSVNAEAASQGTMENTNSQIIDLDKYIPTNTLPKISTTVKIEESATPKKVTSDLPLMKSVEDSPIERGNSTTHIKVIPDTAHSNGIIASLSGTRASTAPADAPSNPAHSSSALEPAAQQDPMLVKDVFSSTEEPKSNEANALGSRLSVVIPSNISVVSPKPAFMPAPARQSVRTHDVATQPDAPSHTDLPGNLNVPKSERDSSMTLNSTNAPSEKAPARRDVSNTMSAPNEEIPGKTSKAPAARGRPPKKPNAPRPASPVEPPAVNESNGKTEKPPVTKGRPRKKPAEIPTVSPPIQPLPANRGKTHDKFPTPVPNNSTMKSGNAAPKPSVPKVSIKNATDKPPAVKASASETSAPNPPPTSKGPPAKPPSMKAPPKASSAKISVAKLATNPSVSKPAGVKSPATNESTEKPSTAKAMTANAPVVKNSAPKASATKAPAPSKKRKSDDDGSVASTNKKSKTEVVEDKPEVSSKKSAVAKPTTSKSPAPKTSATVSKPRAPDSKAKAAKAAKAAGLSMMAELEDLATQKKLGAPPPILNERSRSQARAVRDGTVPPLSPTKAVRKRGRDDTESADEAEVAEKVQRVVKKGKRN